MLSEVGGFGGLFEINTRKYRKPVLVSSVDGVGTKLKVAFAAKRHSTIGQDLVNHCVNDIAVIGAEPLFFLDYIGTGTLKRKAFSDIVRGFAIGCRENNCSLVGGETAEMPDTYLPGEHDLVGIITGIVDKEKIITGENILPGDILVGLPSNGLHTNGYSLARKIFFESEKYNVDTYIDSLKSTVGEALLKPHINYTNHVFKVLEKNIEIKGVAHITGGGLTENIPRILPDNCSVKIKKDTWPN